MKIQKLESLVRRLEGESREANERLEAARKQLRDARASSLVRAAADAGFLDADPVALIRELQQLRSRSDASAGTVDSSKEEK